MNKSKILKLAKSLSATVDHSGCNSFYDTTISLDENSPFVFEATDCKVICISHFKDNNKALHWLDIYEDLKHGVYKQ